MNLPFCYPRLKSALFLLAAMGILFLAAPVRAELKIMSHVGHLKALDAAYEDTFVKLAREYNLGYVEMRAANPHVDPWLPGEGTRIILPSLHLLPDAPQDGIVINLPEMRLYVFEKPGQPPATYPIGIGREGLDTPLGTTRVTNKREGPTWRPTARMRSEDPSLPEVVPPGPDNPLGSHAIYLGWPEYLIHGTHKPFGIGRRISSGCIRMYPEDIPHVFDVAKSGMRVTVVDQPVKAGWIGDFLYMEAHPTIDQADRMEIDGQIGEIDLEEKDILMILRAAGPHAENLNWARIRAVARERRGYPIPVAARVRGAALPELSTLIHAVDRVSLNTDEARNVPKNDEAELETVQADVDVLNRQANMTESRHSEAEPVTESNSEQIESVLQDLMSAVAPETILIEQVEESSETAD